ncbi:Hypp8741 [Branchiostoma lanceolatum]|uniref:Hypp8741 protein n=1 Tax=Branchiostoma lanceolatum TaxID=7740 RepID=A0A8K0EIY7_BRALA|nr:Hypp8741 [Branchiostoma lanceolatum]
MFEDTSPPGKAHLIQHTGQTQEETRQDMDQTQEETSQHTDPTPEATSPPEPGGVSRSLIKTTARMEL